MSAHHSEFIRCSRTSHYARPKICLSSSFPPDPPDLVNTGTNSRFVALKTRRLMKKGAVMPSVARHLLFLVENKQNQIPRFARNDGPGDFHVHWWAEGHVKLGMTSWGFS